MNWFKEDMSEHVGYPIDHAVEVSIEVFKAYGLPDIGSQLDKIEVLHGVEIVKSVKIATILEPAAVAVVIAQQLAQHLADQEFQVDQLVGASTSIPLNHAVAIYAALAVLMGEGHQAFEESHQSGRVYKESSVILSKFEGIDFDRGDRNFAALLRQLSSALTPVRYRSAVVLVVASLMIGALVAGLGVWGISDRETAAPTPLPIAAVPPPTPTLADMATNQQNLALRTFAWLESPTEAEFESSASVAGTDRIQTLVMKPGQQLGLDISIGRKNGVDPSRVQGEKLVLDLFIPNKKVSIVADSSYVYNAAQPNGIRLPVNLGADRVAAELNSDGFYPVWYRVKLQVAESTDFACGRSPLVLESWFANEGEYSVMSPNLIYVDNDCSWAG